MVPAKKSAFFLISGFISSPPNIVGCIAKCMLRRGEYNKHLYGGYTEDTAPSSNVNDSDEDESK